MRKYQKKITVMVMAIILLLLSIMMIGCVEKDDKYKETEYFVYHYYTVKDHEEVEIDHLTEKGKQLKNIVIPEEIDGKKVTIVRGASETPNLKKIIVSYNVKLINSWGLTSGSLFVINFPHWPKVLYVNCEYEKCAVMGGGYIATNAEESFAKRYPSLQGFSFANMQYLYNYSDSPNKDVFFIDDLNINEELEVIPETPKRDGYTFIGWYAEPECLNRLELNGYVKTDDEIVYLYAGWKENIK